MEPAEDSLIGQTIAGYRIDALLSRDAAGIFYRALQIAVQRTVVLRVLDPRLVEDRQTVVRFVQEARAAAQLRHPNIVQVHDVRHEGQRVFYSMEHLPGGTLASWVEEEGKLPAPTVLALLRDALAAVSFAEENGVTHCELAPDRLFLTEDRRLKVLGLAAGGKATTASAGTAGPAETASPDAASLNTLAYLAPEQLIEGTADHRSSLYSLGCTTYFALTGKPPFSGESAKAILSAKVLREPPPLTETDAPRWLVELVSELMAREPSLRPQSPEEVSDRIEKPRAKVRLATSSGARLHASGAGSASSGAKLSRSARPQSEAAGTDAPPRRLWVQLGAAALALGILVAVLVVVSGDPSTPDSDERTLAGGPTPDPAGDVAIEDSRLRGPEPRSGGDRVRGTVEVAPTPRQDESSGAVRAVPSREPPRESTVEAGLDALRAVMSNWRSKLLTQEETRQAIERLQARYSQPEVAEQARRYLDEIQTREIEVLRQAVARDVEPKVKAGRYLEALQALDRSRETQGMSAELFQVEVRRVVAAATEALQRTMEKAEDLSASGKTAEAEGLLRALGPRLPLDLRSQADEGIAKLRKLATMAAQLETGLAEAERQWRERLGVLDFAGAEAALAPLPADGPPQHRARLESLRGELARMKAAWEGLRAGLQAAAGSTASVELGYASAARGSASFNAKVRELRPGDDGELTLLLETGPRKTESCAVLDLKDEVLVRIAAGSAARTPEATSTQPPESQLVEGLGLVALHRRGPKRAWRCLTQHPALPQELRSAYSDRLVAAGESLIAEACRSAVDLAGQLNAKGSAAALDDWKALAAKIERIVEQHFGLPYFQKHRAEALALHRKTFRGGSQTKDLLNLLHGKPRLGNDGVLKLRYDFTSDEELEDFVIKRGSAKVEQKSLLLTGECRLLSGNPFRTWLSVKFAAPSYNKSSPNVNVALWTHEEDRVTYDLATSGAPGTARTPVPGSPDDPKPAPPAAGAGIANDYLAFCVGYQPKGISSYTYYDNVLYLTDVNRDVPMPAFTILGGSRGKPLHDGDTAYRLHALWAESILNKVKGTQQVQLILKPDSFDWYVNSSRWSHHAVKLNPQLPLRLARLDATGSVTLFTNSQLVYFSMLEVEGPLDPSWLEAESNRQADVEFARIEARNAL
jgi:serine/threonine protein kinase